VVISERGKILRRKFDWPAHLRLVLPSRSAWGQGVSGVAVFIQKWRLDRANYIAVPVMSDGREGPPLELRSLFEQFHTEAR
jgi:hypothetical protein